MKVKTILKKGIGIILSTSMILTSAFSTRVNAAESFSSEIYNYKKITDPQTLDKELKNGIKIGNFTYSGEINEEFNNAKYSKYNVVENGFKYDMYVNKETLTYTINGKEYSFDDFLKAVDEQYKNFFSKSTHSNTLVDVLDKYDYTVSNINYDKLNSEFENKNYIHNHNSIERCTSCPIGSMSPPKNNFQSKEYNLGTQDRRLLIALTTGAIAAIATWATWGTLSVGKACLSGAISAFGGAAVGMYTYWYYTKYQSFHKVCPIAVKERRKIWTNNPVGSGGYYTNKYNYFYSSRP